jgi:hypothetical protein
MGRRAHTSLPRTIGYLIGEDEFQNVRYSSIGTNDVSVSNWDPSPPEHEFSIKANGNEYNIKNI